MIDWRNITWIREGDCWRCTSHSRINQRREYVGFWIGKKRWIMHRYVYCQKEGKELSSDVVVRHMCDNQWCINPEHLVEGSVLDNINDRQERKRQANGNKIIHSKLDAVKVRGIFVRVDKTYVELGAEFGVTKRTILDIKARKVWSHVTADLVVERRVHDYSGHISKWMVRDEKTGRLMRAGNELS